MAGNARVGGHDIEPLEFWASVEPTVARTSADRYRDQLAETGHDAREGDLDRIAALGVQATRYPVLWEKTAPDDPRHVDLRWAAARLERLRALGVEPIVTLLHHGSGPRYTSLVDPAFPALFAEYAAHVARAFPWVRRWTPLNEPLTTARFSTLYGHWFPNRVGDHAAFGAAIVNEAEAIRRAMRAIRAVNASAQLVLTEDLQDFTAGDAAVAAYVEHKRERSYLSVELLLGRVRPGHAMWDYVTGECNVPASRLRDLAADPTPPDLLGYNYYPNSQRFLATRPDGAFDNRALIEVVPERVSPRPLFAAAYERLGRPMALSEVHLHGDDAARLRWLRDRFDDVSALRAQGMPLLAFGVWAVFGMVDWQSLLLREEGVREDGVYRFAAPGDVPQPTPLVDAIRALVRRR